MNNNLNLYRTSLENLPTELLPGSVYHILDNDTLFKDSDNSRTGLLFKNIWVKQFKEKEDPIGCIKFEGKDRQEICALILAEDDSKRLIYNGIIEYSLDGENFLPYLDAEVITGTTIYFRGYNNTAKVTHGYFNVWNKNYDRDLKILSSGEIADLIDYKKNLVNEPIVITDPTDFFYLLFADSSTLSSAPNFRLNNFYIENDNPLNLNQVFMGTSLILPPKIELPLSAKEVILDEMFLSCHQLQEAAIIKYSNDLKISSYYMYDSCENLKGLPSLKNMSFNNVDMRCLFSSCSSIKISETLHDEYLIPYPITGTFSADSAYVLNPLYEMFFDIGGEFLGTPEIGKTYYLSTDNYIVS